MAEYRYSAAELCEALGIYSPTDQQRAIIEAPLEGVYRVVAGAGSGKTETMALRVVWLVANGLVAPKDVLGLTFTRKAAGELSERIHRRIRALSDIAGQGDDIFQLPQVSTYNAFASRLFQDYAVFLGLDGEADVAGSAASWALARRVIVSSTHPELEQLDLSVDQLTSLTWSLSQAMSEHAASADDLQAFAAEFSRVALLETPDRFPRADVDKWAESVGTLRVLAELVEEFRAEKLRAGLVDYSDQIRLGLQVVRDAPDVTQQMRERHRVVLLDEYQDTSVLQTTLLQTLFSDHPVMSVGDPLQAIYGWRGASASNLADFPADFAKTWPVTTFGLQTSWRNPAGVLAVANQLCEPLRTPELEVGVLQEAPGADPGTVDTAFLDTIVDEADHVAQWFSDTLAAHAGDQTPPDAALLLRERKHQGLFAAALEAKGIPVHILGIGGLLADPLVADLVAGLALSHRPMPNGEMVRLLTSGRFRLGVADLYALSGVAHWLGLRDDDGSAVDEALVEAMRHQATGRPRASLVDAVLFLATRSDDHGQWAGLSDEGRKRVRDAAALIRTQRMVSHQGIVDQILHWEKLTGVDIEWMSHERHESYREARQAFLDAARQYQALGDGSGVAGFLGWLEEAETRDSLQPQSAPPEPGCVQILTIHGAKGLEWDLVAVAGNSSDFLPSRSKDGTTGWLRKGTLPYPFRGDKKFLPELEWEQAADRKELADAVKQFKTDVAEHHLREERRVAYVGFTRTKRDLLLTGSFWSTRKTVHEPSRFLIELADHGLIPSLPEGPESNERPESLEGETMVWPADPLGARRARVEAAAALVGEVPAPPENAQDNADGSASGSENVPPELRAMIDAVIERDLARQQPVVPQWAVRIPASQFDRWVYEPEEMLQGQVQPRPPTTGLSQQRGNQFHAWVEQYFAESHGGVFGDVDLDDDQWQAPDLEVEKWKESFELSEFATLVPEALEREIHLPVGEHIVICKIDAVFIREGRVVIVDWKTGRAPDTPDELQRKSLQLALYREAWASWSGTSADDIDAVFWFSQEARVVAPPSLASADQLRELLEQAKARSAEERAEGVA